MAQRTEGLSKGRYKADLRLKLASAAEVLLTVAVVVGASASIGASLYIGFWHPRWSGRELFEALWVYYALGMGAIAFDWIFGQLRR